MRGRAHRTSSNLRLGHLAWAAAFALFVAPGAALAGDLYGAANIGVAVGVADSSGFNTFGGGFSNSGSDDDSSPSFGGAIGFTFPLDQALGRQLELPEWAPWKIEVPSWHLRFEIEAVAGQDDEFTTQGFAPSVPYQSQVSSWSLLANSALEVPFGRPLSRALGRVPVLDPLSFDVGAGVGYGQVTLETSDTISRGKSKSHNLVWQAGAGLAYGLSPRVSIRVGYRYLDRGKVSADLFSGPIPSGNFNLELASHEVGTSLRVAFYSVPFPNNSRWSGREW